MYLRNITSEQYQEALVMAHAMREEMLPRVIGRFHAAWQCGCGEIHVGDSVSYDIRTPSSRYPEQIAGWFSWSVALKDVETGEHSSSVGLSEYFTRDELAHLYEKHFGAWVRANFPDQYQERLESQGSLWI